MTQRKNCIRTGLCASMALGAFLFAASSEADCQADLSALDEKLAAAEGIEQKRRQMLQGLRDMAGRYCDQGREELASQMIHSINGQIAHATGASGEDEESRPSRPKADLTAGYLEGMWCVSSDRHDRIVPVRFEPGGGHLVGQPAGDKYAMYPNGDDLEDFYRGFDQLVSRQSDEFVVIDRGRELTYQRGTCPGIEIAG
ncbi:MAG: hypothetical protein U5K33_09965 [Halofilum sp. (in: g-proteobacteria)]|nr:hypothetical protein [Halofilum sp. (in: g-proteobacteria)]